MLLRYFTIFAIPFYSAQVTRQNLIDKLNRQIFNKQTLDNKLPNFDNELINGLINSIMLQV